MEATTKTGAAIAKEISEKLKDKSESMSAIARRTGLSIGYVSLVLRGKRCPAGLPVKKERGITTAEKLANTLGITVEELGRFCDWAEKSGGIKL